MSLHDANQLSIDDVTFWNHKGDEFSREANKTMRPHKAKLRAAVLAFIGSRGPQGATSEECELGLNMPHTTVSARFTELKALGLLQQIGKRKTQAGRWAGVWVTK